MRSDGKCLGGKFQDEKSYSIITSDFTELNYRVIKLRDINIKHLCNARFYLDVELFV